MNPQAMKNPSYLRHALALSLALSACSGPDDAEVENVAPEDIRTTSGWEEFRKSVHESSEGFFVVDGDIRINSEQELHDYYQEHFTQSALTIATKCSGFFCSTRVDSKWDNSKKLDLTYCVSAPAFGSNYDRVVDAMKAASEAWEAVIHVNFVHRREFDGNCTASQSNVVFDVRPFSDPEFSASAFFPYDSRANRNLFIDVPRIDRYWDLTLIGVLRHELGHALGFRHEHIRVSSGCRAEDNYWRGLTGYDSDSVMHYPECGGTAQVWLSLSETDLVGAASVYGLPPVRIGHVDTSGTLYVKEGGLNASWVVQTGSVADFQLEGSRIGVRHQDGLVHVKEGGLDASWSLLAGGVTKLQLEGDRIGVLSGGNLYVKEGPLDASWTLQIGGISDFQLEGRRIGVRAHNGLVYVKEGPLDASWSLLAGAVTKFQLEGNRVGVLEGGLLYVKEGSLDASWIRIRGNVADFQLEKTRIAMVDSTTRDLYVTEQKLSASIMHFSKLFDSVASFQLEQSRIAVLTPAGALYVMGGSIDKGWSLEWNTTTAFQLYGNRIVVQDSSGGLYAKETTLDAPWAQLSGGSRLLKVAGTHTN